MNKTYLLISCLVTYLMLSSCAGIGVQSKCVSGNCINGQGTYTWSIGKYVGEFKDGNFHGQGTLILPDGAKIVGEFKDDNLPGQGTFTSPDGSKYVGEFKDGNFHGKGTYTYPDGRKYVGEFKDDNFHGKGTLTHPDGTIEIRDSKGNDLLESGKYQEAIDVYKQAISIKPDDDAYYGLAKAYLKLGKYKEAIEAYKLAGSAHNIVNLKNVITS